MTHNLLLVFASPAEPEREDEFNFWYNTYNLQQVLRVPGVLAGTRYRLSHAQMDWFPPMTITPQWPYGKDSYVCLFEIDIGVSPSELFKALKDDEPARQTHSPDDDPAQFGLQLFYEATTERETQVWLEPGVPEPVGPEDHRPPPIFIVPTTPVSPEMEGEYSKWYVTQMNIRMPGIVAGTRYKLSTVQGMADSRGMVLEGAWPYGQHSHLMIYELSDTLTAANALRARTERARVAAGSGGGRYSWMAPWGPMRKADEHLVYEPVTNRVRRSWIRDPRAI